MKLSQRARAVEPFYAMSFGAQAAALEAQGHDVVKLSIGEPSFGAPEAVRSAVALAVAEVGATLVVVEHQLAHWVDVCDRLVVLGDGGRVVADGPMTSTLAAEGERLAELGLWVPGAPPPSSMEVATGLVTPVRPGGRGQPGGICRV